VTPKAAESVERGAQADWGELSPRWVGIRSEVVDVRGTSVHLLRAEACPDAPPDAPTHLLIHTLGASGTNWLDVMPGLAAYGPVIAPDLPGSLAGRTVSPNRKAESADENVRFLSGLTSTLGLDHVAVHGWSTGGLVALLFADREPDRVERLVLANPTLPGPMSTAQRIGWQTLGRLALLVGRPAARVLLWLFGDKVLDLKQRYSSPDVLSASRFDVVGGDLSRLSPELAALFAEDREGARLQPQRWSGAVAAFVSAVSAMYIDRRPAEDAVDRLSAPTLLLWGDQDPLIERAVIDDLLARRPDWSLHVLKTVGHLVPLEAPDAYVDVVGQWLVGEGAVSKSEEPRSQM